MPDPVLSNRAVVLLSGGLDSATVLAVARHKGRQCCCLSFDYGQRHRHELAAAARISTVLGACEHLVIPLDFRPIGGSALTSAAPVPKDRAAIAMSAEIPVTYVPARNLVFLSIAAAFAEARDASEIYIGVNAIDYSGYPDCRPEFIDAFSRCVNLGTRRGTTGKPIVIQTPLANLSKAQIIRMGVELGVDYALTHSCYDPDDMGRACARCDSCLLRAAGFAQAGVADPTVYLPRSGGAGVGGLG
ncbi:MAG: 7-cyano-7-deazaguanine synthase QueC [Phycisphaeraceae bacterium]|nr:7-cyano-7-deazaguanine synthase QueC [Phycisphaeraceae bacterium]